MPVTTVAEIPGPVNVDFQLQLLRNAKALCPYFVGSDPAEITSHGGTFTAKWRRYENLTPTTTALTEITGSVAFPTRTGTQPTVTDITATLSKFGDFIYLTEEVDLINFSHQGAKLMEILGIQAGRSLNRLQRNVLEDNATAFLAGTATTATLIDAAAADDAELKVSDISLMVNTLQNLDARKFTARTTGSTNIGTQPIRDAFWGLAHYDVEEDVRLLSSFVAVQTYVSQTEVMAGEFGEVGGVRFISSSESSIDAGAGQTSTGSATVEGRNTSDRADIYNTVVLARDAHGSVGLDFSHTKEIYRAGDSLPGVQVIQHARGSAGSADPLNELSTVGWKSWHVGTILNGDWVRVFRSTASILEEVA